ncbi:conserved hypothetical protein [Psychrobacter arcticus 273-4]|uniref:Uncharacterized protein n=1 Tax=Psychrobacter arcticus (strain DSM 17307 / VKM B-2377 / 273-4) TaxID=259536 RepID=Q4FVC8_PSYA2|nr:conserved hypothetical protein [Psychrobacter arcticus 273-4]
MIIAAEVTDELMPRVVSIPHGFGHGRKGVKQEIAQAHAGVSVNDLTDDTLLKRCACYKLLLFAAITEATKNSSQQYCIFLIVS